MNHPDEGLIHDFVDDEATPEQRARVALHLADCAHCRAVVAAARKLKEEALRTFGDAEEPVPADQWNAIAARLRAAGAPVMALPVSAERDASRARMRPSTSWRTVVAASLVLAAGAWAFSRFESSPAAPIALDVPSPSVIAVKSEPREPAAAIAAAYAPVFTQLEQLLAEQRDQLQPETITVLETNIAILNKAIADIQAALAADPANLGGLDALDGIYQAKLGLLRAAVTLAPQV